MAIGANLDVNFFGVKEMRGDVSDRKDLWCDGNLVLVVCEAACASLLQYTRGGRQGTIMARIHS